MYITCHECNTIFRLEERRLNPAGSKVRCSQCGNIFMAFPTASDPEAKVSVLAPDSAKGVAAGSPNAQPAPGLTDAYGTALQPDGLDLSALDALLDPPGRGESTTEASADDLDLDFDMDLDADDTGAGRSDDAVGSKAAALSGQSAGKAESFDDLDLEMDFELDDGLDEPIPPRDALAEDLAAHAKAAVSESTGNSDIGMELSDLDLGPGEEHIAETSEDDQLDLDLDFDLEDLSMEAAQPVQKAPRVRPTEPPGTPGGAEAGEIDLADLGDLIDAPQNTPSHAPGEDVELELDLTDDHATSEPGAKPGGDDLDLAGELGEMLNAIDAPSAKTKKIDGLDLGGDFKADAVPQAEVKGSTPPEEFDLDDLASILEDDTEESTPASRPDVELELDSEAHAEDAGASEQLDLGELDHLLAKEDTARTDAAAHDATIEASDEGLEELEFELDAEFEDKPIARQRARRNESPEEAAELDLSDIEEMLEGEGLKRGELTRPVGMDLKDLGDLGEIDLGDIEKAIDADDGVSLELVEGDEPELDLSIDGQEPLRPQEASEDPMDLDLDIVATMAPLDQKKGVTADAQAPLATDEELDLVLEMDDAAPQPKRSVQPAAAGKEADFDLSDLGDLVEESGAAKADTIDTGDIELEFEIEDEAEPIIAQTSARVSRPINEMADAEYGEAAEPVKKKPAARPRSAQKKKGLSKLLLVILLLVAIAGGLFYAIQYKVQIPYVSPYIERYITPYINHFLDPQPVDPDGIAKLSTTDVNSKFIENEEGGRLFIITGNVRSGYPEARTNIQVRGKLYGAGKLLVKTEQTIAGIALTDQELATKPIPDIKQQLTKSPGAQQEAQSLAPGKSLPFMVVFSELPDNLDEFAIELIHSQKGQ